MHCSPEVRRQRAHCSSKSLLVPAVITQGVPSLSGSVIFTPAALDGGKRSIAVVFRTHSACSMFSDYKLLSRFLLSLTFPIVVRQSCHNLGLFVCCQWELLGYRVSSPFKYWLVEPSLWNVHFPFLFKKKQTFAFDTQSCRSYPEWLTSKVKSKD